jgi:hypothetical protein
VTVQTSAQPIAPNSRTAAWGVFNDSISDNGWSVLDVHTSASFADDVQVYAAGYAEGVVTQGRSYETVMNSFGGLDYNGTALGDFVDAQLKWVDAQVAANVGDAYWHHVGLLFTQVRAMYAGYSSVAPPSQALDFNAYFSPTLSGDLDDLCTVLNCSKMASRGSTGVGDGHCSLLVKPVWAKGSPYPTDLLMAHTTWSGFDSLLRVYKRYDFPLTMDGSSGSGIVPATTIAFTSYPAALFSDDDWCGAVCCCCCCWW